MPKLYEVIDYTTWRKGRNAGRLGKIDLCPVCGRKGAVRLAYLNSGTKAEDHRRMITHKRQELPMLGGQFETYSTFDGCWQKLDLTDTTILEQRSYSHEPQRPPEAH